MANKTPNFDLMYALGPSERPGPEESDYLRLVVDLGVPKFFATNPAATKGLVYAWFGGLLSGRLYPGGSMSVQPNSTNYFEVDNAGSVTGNGTGFTDGRMALAIVRAGETEIDIGGIQDVRSLVSAGPQGVQGDKGDIGPPPVLGVGNVITLPPGSDAQASVEPVPGQDGSYALTFRIPRGRKGEKGDDGEDGTSVTIEGSLGSASELPASARKGAGYLINGDLHVWSGSGWDNVGRIKGEQGDQGEIGPPPEIEVGTVSQVAWDSPPVVEILPKSDVPGRYLANFQIPEGRQGEQGEQGDKGDKGDKGDPGDDGTDGLDGEKGDKGDIGPPPTIEIGEVLTLSPDSQAIVDIYPKPDAPEGSYLVDIHLPRGEQGEPGKDGEGAGSVTSVDVAAKGDGLEVLGGPITSAGKITISLSADMAAIEALDGTGFARRMGSDEWELLSGGAARSAIKAQEASPMLDGLGSLSAQGFVYLDAKLGPTTVQMPSLTWANISEKPMTFPPAQHGHALQDISDAASLKLPWANITGAPGKFAPEDHTHLAADISDLSLSWANVTGKPEGYPPAPHKHAAGDLELAWEYISGKPGLAAAGHGHAAGEITGLGAMAMAGDAPSDGKQYARKNNAWARVAAAPSGSGGGGGGSTFAYAFAST